MREPGRDPESPRPSAPIERWNGSPAQLGPVKTLYLTSSWADSGASHFSRRILHDFAPCQREHWRQTSLLAWSRFHAVGIRQVDIQQDGVAVHLIAKLAMAAGTRTPYLR